MKLKSIMESFIVSGLLVFVSSACGCGGASDGSGNTPPAVPSVISATKGDYQEKIVITWEDVEGAESYVIYKSIENPDSFKVLATRVKGIAYEDTPVNSGRVFYYKVAAAKGNAWSNPSIEVIGFALKGTPQPPETVWAQVNKICEISIEWTASLNPDTISYKILRADKMYGTYELQTEITLPSELTWTDTTVIPDKKYYYKITAVNGNGEGAQSAPVPAIALQRVPAAPVNIAVSKGTFGDKVLITWGKTEFASSYTLFRADEIEIEGVPGPGEYVKIAENINGEVYEDRDNQLITRADYYYKAVAVSSGGQSEMSDYDYGSFDSDIPALVDAPVNVKASKGKTNLITVSWNIVVDSVRYSIYRCTSPAGTYIKIGDVDAPTITYDDGPEEPITKYYYKITAWSRSALGIEKESTESIIPAEGYANPQIPAVPTGLTMAINHTAGTIIANWGAADRAKTYNVYSSDEYDGTYNILSANQAGLSHTDTSGTTIEFGVPYYYKIEAINEGGKSEQSAIAGGILLKTPTGLAASRTYKLDISYDYTITWTPVTGSTGYELVYDNTTTVSIPGGTTSTKSFNIKWGGTHNFKIRAVFKNNNLDVKGNFSGEITK